MSTATSSSGCVYDLLAQQVGGHGILLGQVFPCVIKTLMHTVTAQGQNMTLGKSLASVESARRAASVRAVAMHSVVKKFELA